LQKELGNKNISIKIDSDRACYILAEVWKGNARGFSDVIFLGIGTGIGAGILVNNEVLRGAHDIGGAIGWMALNKPFDKKFIPCGCFEYNASGEGLVKVAKELIADKKFSESPLNKKDPAALSAKDIFDGYDANDKLAIMVINNAIEYWGMAVANLVSLFNPEKIIFGGGVFGPALKFLDAIYDEAKKWAQPISIQHVTLEGAALGNEAGLYGAGYLALKG
jgi:glucokinase